MQRVYKLLIILGFFLCLPMQSVFADEAEDFRERVADMAVVRSIRVGASLDNVRIVIDASKEMEFSTMVLSDPGRIVVNIKNAWVSPEVSRETMIGSRFASKVRVGQFDKNTVRVVVETEVKKGNYDIFTLNLEGALPRLVMDFGRVGKGSRENGTLQNLSDGKETEVKEEMKSEVIFKPGLKGKYIAIDPGHGGEDAGAIGPTGVMEKNLTLRISNELKKMLEASGAKVLMTRETDTEVSPKHREANDVEELQARCDLANKARTDIFVCIHMDSFTSNVANGTTGFYYAKGTASSKKLAQTIQSGVVSELKTESRGTKSCNFYVLKHTNMPATLIEVAFLSNPAEEKMMNANAGVKKAAEGIFNGIADFFGE